MTDTIINTINKFAYGYVFTASDFSLSVEKQKTINRILDNLVTSGKLRRLSKGRFYKAKISKYGESTPNDYQTVKDLLVKNGKIIGYITGYSVFNQLALTTQVPFTIQIGCANEKNAIKRGHYKIRFIKQKNTITKANIPLLQLLDCLRFFKNIPDSFPNERCQRLLVLFGKLDENQREKVKKLALKYTPQTIALLGAILETLNPQEDLTKLQKALNHQTSYNLEISEKILPTQKKWNII